MRALIVATGLLFSTSAFAQGVDFPVHCNGRVLTPRVEALCNEHRSATLEAEQRYLTALSRVGSVADWKALYQIRLMFMSSYYSCATKGNTPAVAECLTPAFDELLSRLPPPSTGASTDLKIQASRANSIVSVHARDALNSCSIARIKALDDGVSSARDIASTIGAACKPQAMEAAVIQFGTINTSFLAETPSLRDQLDMAEQLVSPDQFVTNVLEYRAQKRATPQPPKKEASPRKVNVAS